MTSGTDWRQIRDEFAARDLEHLDGAELDRLADAYFWTDAVQRSIDTRGHAYRAHATHGDEAAAGMAAWRLFYDHFLVDELAVASGWLARAHRHVSEDGEPLAGWLALADADLEPDAETAATLGSRAIAIATAHDDTDLSAMALTSRGRSRLATGQRREGLTDLDEAMVAVINDELSPMYTGWVFCNVVGTCYAIADVRRASEWSDAAMRWCDTLRDGHMYPGLCRVYRAEVDTLRGAWDQAADAAEQACHDLERFDERYAADAHHLRGELARRRGRLDEAQAAFDRTVELGGAPLPGQALLDAATGRPDRALDALVAAAEPGRGMPLHRAVLARATIDVAILAGDEPTATAACHTLVELAEAGDSALLDAHALAGTALITAEPEARHTALRAAIEAFVEEGVPFEAAQLQVACAETADQLGDTRAASRLRELAAATFEALGVVAASPAPRDGVLTAREREVLALIADGCTNGEAAAHLTISPHTVNRHVTNIMTKLGVHTRAAASAKAIADGLL